MSLDLADFENRATNAVKLFWGNRSTALERQIARGTIDSGTRGSVTGGKNMDGFLVMVTEIVRKNGLKDAQICLKKGLLTLPGYYRPTKLWDMLIMNHGRLVAAIEFKSQVGSFGNNFNNRTEESIGTAHDLWTAYREGAFGKDAPRPFIGWVMLIEDCAASRTPVSESAPHFQVFPEFRGASYANRYDILCRKLVQEGLYTSSAFLLSPNTAATTGTFTHMSDLTSLRSFVSAFAGHIATEAAK